MFSLFSWSTVVLVTLMGLNNLRKQSSVFLLLFPQFCCLFRPCSSFLLPLLCFFLADISLRTVLVLPYCHAWHTWNAEPVNQLLSITFYSIFSCCSWFCSSCFRRIALSVQLVYPCIICMLLILKLLSSFALLAARSSCFY